MQWHAYNQSSRGKRWSLVPLPAGWLEPASEGVRPALDRLDPVSIRLEQAPKRHEPTSALEMPILAPWRSELGLKRP